MADVAGKIIVLRSYDNVIMANLAKTKLDAYGIPCFITDENFTGLYPIRNEIFPGARLHVFQKDLDQATQVLVEEHSAPGREIFHCPRCQSSEIKFEERNKGFLGRLFVSAFLFLAGMTPLPRKRSFHCYNCGHEFGSQ